MRKHLHKVRKEKLELIAKKQLIFERNITKQLSYALIIKGVNNEEGD
jgi:hypothetical protein